MNDVDFVVYEVRDLLRAGRVGLYEFTEILRSRYPSAPAAELEPASLSALSTLLSDPNVVLGVYRWTEPEFRADALGTVPRPSDWNTPPEETFLGIQHAE